MYLFNVARLRRHFTNLREATPNNEGQTSGDGALLSRRDFLTLAACFSVPLQDRLAVHRDSHGVTISLNDKLKWRITPALFGKRARLHVEESGDAVHVALAGATYAGTAIDASFRATIYRGWPGWLIKVEHDAWSEPAEADFGAWL